jgi:hypothetical protein
MQKYRCISDTLYYIICSVYIYNITYVLHMHIYMCIYIYIRYVIYIYIIIKINILIYIHVIHIYIYTCNTYIYMYISSLLVTLSGTTLPINPNKPVVVGAAPVVVPPVQRQRRPGYVRGISWLHPLIIGLITYLASRMIHQTYIYYMYILYIPLFSHFSDHLRAVPAGDYDIYYIYIYIYYYIYIYIYICIYHIYI